MGNKFSLNRVKTNFAKGNRNGDDITGDCHKCKKKKKRYKEHSEKVSVETWRVCLDYSAEYTACVM